MLLVVDVSEIPLRWTGVSPSLRGIRRVRLTIISSFFLLGIILDEFQP